MFTLIYAQVRFLDVNTAIRALARVAGCQFTRNLKKWSAATQSVDVSDILAQQEQMVDAQKKQRQQRASSTSGGNADSNKGVSRDGSRDLTPTGVSTTNPQGSCGDESENSGGSSTPVKHQSEGSNPACSSSNSDSSSNDTSWSAAAGNLVQQLASKATGMIGGIKAEGNWLGEVTRDCDGPGR